jgi:hypothetical protein
MHRIREFFQSQQPIETSISGTCFEPFPFPTTPYEFLEYAELDLHSNVPHALANSLSNSKRSMDCQLDYFLKAYGLQSVANANKWQTGKKIRIVGDLGVVPNRILYKINEARNDLEHRFQSPSRPTTENALDVVGTFVAAVDAYLYPVHSGAYFSIEDPDAQQRPFPQSVLTEPQHFLQLTLKDEDIIEARGSYHGGNYTLEVNALNETPNYMYLLTYLLHFHRFYMPNGSKFFSKLRFLRDDSTIANEN